MRTKYFNIIIGCFLLMILSSCKKYINLAPIDATYDQVFWADGNNAENGLSGAYGLLRDGFEDDRSFFVFGDLPSDEFIMLNPPYWNYQSLQHSGGFKYSYAPYLAESLQNWTRFYKVINQCHLVCENVPNISADKFSGGQSEKDDIIGEGHFLRAYTYFYITRVWGDPVLTTSSIKNPQDVVPLPRTSEDTVLNYCIQDLKTAAALLPFYSGTDRDKVHADKGAAWATLAQVYAWQHDYQNAALYCDSVINSGQYSLETIDNYNAIWLGSDPENIFEINMKYNAQNNEATGFFFGEFLSDPFIKGQGLQWEINPDNIQYIFPDTARDQRYSKVTAAVTDGRILSKYANVDYYDPNDQYAYVVNNNLVVERLADIYLLKAEASNALGNTADALLNLNKIRERAGLPDTTIAGGNDLKIAIMDERLRELIGEGCVAFDMIRTGTLLNYFGDVYTQERIDKKGYYWPLDMRTLLPQDILLTQNPWWANH
ncbi:MAG: RagB/SusD family nutrient uptake outer membrane protein [Chitinophagaceae bacterium]